MTATSRRSNAPATRQRRGAAADGPPSVIRGAKSIPTRTVGIDWFRVSLPASALDDARFILRDLFGGAGEVKPGMFNHLLREQFAQSACLCWSPDESSCIVQITGGGFDLLGDGVDAVAVVHRFLALGGRALRIDVCIDVRGEGLTLIDQAAESCQARELVGARCYSRITPVSGEDVTGDTLTIGKRGDDGSGRYVRLYDKGLEQSRGDAKGLYKRGEWVRYEVEFSGSCAGIAAIQIASVPDAWEEQAVACALGAIDFRAHTGRREIALRPRVEWWAAFVESARTIRVATKRMLSTADSWGRWAARCVYGQLKSLAAISRLEIPVLLDRVCGKVDASSRFLDTQAGRELAVMLTQSPPQAA